MPHYMYAGAVLLRIGDGVSTTRLLNPGDWEPGTFVGYVTTPPVKLAGGRYLVTLDTGEWIFRDTQTLAIWGQS